MSYFDDASLVMIPSGYKDQKVYSVKPIDGSGDLTFSRASNATRVNSSGLVEKVRENLILQSNSFDTTWAPLSGASVTGGQAGYDGTNNAWLLSKSAAGGFIYQSANTLSGLYTISVYAKANASTYIRVNGNAITDADAFFNLSTGAVHTSTNCTARITSVGGGWYRCSISSNDASLDYVNIYPAESSGVSATSGSVFIQASQLETGDIATDYIATTTTAVSVGPVSGLPRLDYSGGASCPSLLLEPQRTNYWPYSEQVNQWVSPADGVTLTSNTAETLSPQGYYNASKIVVVGGNQRNFQLTNSIVGTGTISLFVKAGTGIDISLLTTSGSVYVSFNISTQFVTPTTGTGTITSYGNGWYRITATGTLGVSEVIQVIYGGSAGASFYIWGGQMEQGAYATSYIPTLSSAVTRVADTYQKGGFGNTSTAGTLYYEFEATNINSPNGQYLISLFAGSSVGGAFFADANAITLCGNGPQIQGFNNGYTQLLFTTTPAVGSTVKVALRYDGTNVVAFVNGVKQSVFADTAVGVKNAIRVNNGENGTQATKQLLFFPTALSDADAITLTTL